MKQNMGRLIRYFLIIHKLSGLQKYVSRDELLDYLSHKMRERGYNINISLRTLQRDFREIDIMLGISIKHKHGLGYYIDYRDLNNDIRYEELLMNFDLITSVNPEIRSLGFILPEHHRPKGCDSMPIFISAIKEQKQLNFDYILYRKGNKIINKTVNPYFIKESLGLWYLIATDESGILKSFGIDRIVNAEILNSRYKKDLSIDPETLYKHSYGIWDEPSLPVEHVVLSYSELDGSFIKAKPLHPTQQILIDNNDEFRISVDIKITNDFVMALLSRSTSIEIIEPLSLRERLREIAENCSRRNS